MLLKLQGGLTVDAVPFDRRVRDLEGEVGADIVIARLTAGFMLPVVCAYHGREQFALLPIDSAERQPNGHPFGRYDLTLRLGLGNTRLISVPDQYLLANYLISVGLYSRSGFANEDEVDPVFSSSELYADIKFWQGVEAAIDQLIYIVQNQLPAEDVNDLDDRARRILRSMRFPHMPHNVSAGYEDMAFRLGRFSSFHATRRILLDLPDQPINVDVSWSVRERCRQEYPVFPGRTYMRNPESAVPYIDMPE